MQGTNRTIARLSRLIVAATAVAALAALASPAGAATIEGSSHTLLPERTSGTTVAVAPDGSAWFGALTESGPVLAHIQGKKLSIDKLQPRKARWARTAGLQFDPEGNLWFAEEGPFGSSIVRREPSGTERKFRFSAARPEVNALAIGTEGDVWFTRGWRESPAIGRLTPQGTLTRTPLAKGSRPSSMVVGPDGAAWFTETGPSKIGRVTPGADPQLFTLPPGTHPHQIVAGPDGALWFSEEGRRLAHGQVENRIGRITTNGEVTEFRVPFGQSTNALAADPRGLIWFTTGTGELASISTAGVVGANGCALSCGPGIHSISLAPDGTLWFAADHESCKGCGGGATLMNENLGTPIGSLPTASLAPPSQ